MRVVEYITWDNKIKVGRFHTWNPKLEDNCYAIVEQEDGSIVEIPATNVKFLTEELNNTII